MTGWGRGPFGGPFDSAQDRLRVNGGHRAYMTKIQGRMDSLRRDRRCEIPASAGMTRWVRGNDEVGSRE